MKLPSSIFAAILISLCVVAFTTPPSINNKPLSHRQFTQLLQKHVNKKGDVNYKGFIKDSVALNKYLSMLSNNMPDSLASTNQKFAYWINAYNAFTIKLIISNYPLKSIKDLGSTATNNSPWDKKFFKINGKDFSLNIIEHQILRKQFNDPRLHFAINCASFSCPKLINRAFEPAILQKQFTACAVEFFNDSTKNKITSSQAQLSSIMLWYKTDFTKAGLTLAAYINQYSTNKIAENSPITHLPYNWALNEQ